MRSISIITASYNSEATIRQTIESVLSQNYPSLDFWVIDGGSTDGTLAILHEYQDRIQFISEPDKGIYDAFNKGLTRCTGDYIGFLGSDDFYPTPDVLTAVVDTFESKQAEAVYGDLKYVDGNDPQKVIRNWVSGDYQRSNWLFGWMPPHLAFFITRQVFEEVGPYRDDFRSAGDYEWMLRILFGKERKVSYLKKVLVHMRTGGTSNVSWKNRWRANREDKRAWEINGFRPYFFTFVLKPLRKITQFF